MIDWYMIAHTVDTMITDGDPERALEALREAQSDFGGVPEFHRIQGDALWMVGDLKRGLASYEKALSLEPDSIEYRSAGALALFEMLEVGRAREIAAGTH